MTRVDAPFQKHLQKVEAWLAGQPNITVLYELQRDDRRAVTLPTQINRFLDQRLDSEQMLAAVDRTLYRNRAA
ncbi:hypothetical protein [Candidatus Amarolinea dominans]|uniref:hypothetical protein n=1 Tax=Candidatus Amarolinea dominans TaxID=3140696 RepID=UPI001D2F2C47|nr:hypothetical protein [Anaerolineae bacterium]